MMMMTRLFLSFHSPIPSPTPPQLLNASSSTLSYVIHLPSGLLLIVVVVIARHGGKVVVVFALGARLVGRGLGRVLLDVIYPVKPPSAIFLTFPLTRGR